MFHQVVPQSCTGSATVTVVAATAATVSFIINIQIKMTESMLIVQNIYSELCSKRAELSFKAQQNEKLINDFWLNVIRNGQSLKCFMYYVLFIQNR